MPPARSICRCSSRHRVRGPRRDPGPSMPSRADHTSSYAVGRSRATVADTLRWATFRTRRRAAQGRFRRPSAKRSCSLQRLAEQPALGEVTAAVVERACRVVLVGHHEAHVGQSLRPRVRLGRFEQRACSQGLRLRVRVIDAPQEAGRKLHPPSDVVKGT